VLFFVEKKMDFEIIELNQVLVLIYVIFPTEHFWHLITHIAQTRYSNGQTDGRVDPFAMEI
jgi:hypothetical protein